MFCLRKKYSVKTAAFYGPILPDDGAALQVKHDHVGTQALTSTGFGRRKGLSNPQPSTINHRNSAATRHPSFLCGTCSPHLWDVSSARPAQPVARPLCSPPAPPRLVLPPQHQSRFPKEHTNAGNPPPRHRYHPMDLESRHLLHSRRLVHRVGSERERRKRRLLCR